ncbi:MAG: xylulokinase [Planctomycetota bacterium]
MPLLLGIDIGTSGTKTLLCDLRGQVIATATTPHSISTPKPGWSEQDPSMWWTACGKAVREVLRAAKAEKTDVVGVGLSGQMHGSVFLDDGDNVLRPALLWNDQRTAKQCNDIERAAGGRKRLINMVGNPALTGFTAPKILWVRDNEPAIYKKTSRVLLPKDYIRLCMTGVHATEVSDASGTLLLDVKKRAWNKTLMKKLRLDAELMPPCYESHEVTGHLTAAGARHLGLAEGTPVVGGGGDQACGAVGNGVVKAGIVSATLGTSGVVFAHASEPTYDPQGRVHTMCSAVKGKWCVFGCMLSAGGSLQWYKNQFGEIEAQDAKKRNADVYDILTRKAAAAPVGSDGLFFLPYLTGERCPYPDPDARGCWIGLTAGHERGAVIRSVLEGITFGMRDQLEIFQQMGVKISRVRLSGGGAKSGLWRQLQADIYGKQVALINADEGPAYGAALLAGVGIKNWPSVVAACKAAIRDVQVVKPNAPAARRYTPLHKQYQRLYTALADEFKAMASS